MGWLVILLGGALSALGCIGIYYGWEISDIDRGSSQLIAGSVGLSGGIVTMALGLVLLALAGVRRDLRRGPIAGAPAGHVETAPPQRAPALEPSPTAERKPPERKKRKDRAEPVRSEAPPPTPIHEAVPPAPLPQPVPVAAAVTLGESGAIAAPPAASPVSAPEPDRRDETPPTSGTEPTAAPSQMEKPSHPLAESPWSGRDNEDSPLAYYRFEQELARLDAAETAAARPKLQAAPSEAPPAETPSAALEQGERSLSPPAEQEAAFPSPVVGQYEAGGVSYIMYADGSIRADTPNGVFCFSDINELKTFIHESGTGRS